MNGPYVRRMIPEPGDPDREVLVAETFHEQTDDELTEKEVNCETAQEIWLRVQQMMKGSDIGIQEKKAKLFNEWERNKHFPEKIADNIKFLNNLQPEWRRHVTIVHQTKDLNEVDYTQLYDFLKYNQAEADCTTGYEFGSSVEQQNDSNVISVVSSVEQDGGIVEQHPATIKETRAYFESLYNNLEIEVEKVNSVNRKMKETNADLTTVLARYKNQEKCFEINQEKYDKLKRYYQKSVYQEQCLTKKINALHLSYAKTIMTLNEEIANLNNQLSKEKSTVSFLNEETKKLKSDLKIHEDELLDKQIQLENKIEELDNILVKTGQPIQMMHMLSPKPDLFYHTEQKMTLNIHNWSSMVHQEIHKIVKDKIFPIINQVDARLQNFKIQFLKEADKFVRDFKYLAKEADESLAKHKALEFEIERLLRAVVSQDIMSIVQNNSVIDTSNLQTELDSTKEKLENCIIIKEKEYAVLWNNWKLRAQLSDKVSEQKDTTKGTSVNTQFCKQSILGKPSSSSGSKLYSVTPFPKSKGLPKIDESHALLKPVTSNSTSREDKFVPINKVRASGVDNAAKTRRPQAKSNTKNDRVPSASKSSYIKNKEVEVEEYHRNLLLSKNEKHMSSGCNNIKLAIRNDNLKLFALCKQKENVLNTENQKKQKPKVKKPKKVGSKERLASPTPSEPSICHRWSPTGRLFDCNGKIIKSRASKGQSDNSKGDNACTSNPQEHTIKRFPNSTSFLGRLSKIVYGASCSKHMTRNLKLLINFVWKFLGTVRFGNDHVSTILVWQFCDSYLEVAFRRNSCFIRNLKGVDLLKGNRTTNLYTINLHEMAFASPICLIDHATSTKSWLWHQRLSHLNFDTINDLAKNDLVTSLPKFKYHKEHLCPSCEQGKSKKESHPPKPIQNSKQRLHLLHMDLCGPMRVESINGKRYILVIVDDYSCYTWVHFLRSKDKAPEEIKTFFKKITVLMQALVIIDIEKLGAKVTIGFFIGYSATFCAYNVYNQRTKKIMETMNVTFDELSAIDFEQSSSKPGLQSMTFGQISSGLNLTYAPSTITTQQPTERELDLLFETMYDDYIGGQPLAATRSAPAAQAPQDVDELKTRQQHVQQQDNEAPLQPEIVADC
ncbi:retrovirus-related pol polyprotein from transposon TNT 1-94 [Tanacetum coccineum]